MRGDLPDQGQCRVVDLPHFLKREQTVHVPTGRLQRLTIDPLGGLGIPLHFHVIAELLRADG